MPQSDWGLKQTVAPDQALSWEPYHSPFVQNTPGSLSHELYSPGEFMWDYTGNPLDMTNDLGGWDVLGNEERCLQVAGSQTQNNFGLWMG